MIRYSKEEFKKMSYTLVYKEKILGLNFYYYLTPFLKTLRVFFVDEDESRVELIWLNEQTWRNPKLFETHLKQTLSYFMKRPEIQKKIKKYLLTNEKNYDII